MKEEEVAMIRVEIREIGLENRLKTSTSGEGLVDFETEVLSLVGLEAWGDR
jgi:hypothetical protein